MRHITTPGFLILLSAIVLLVGVVSPYILANLTQTPGTSARLQDWILLPVAASGIAGFLFNSGVKFHSEVRDRAFERFLSLDKNKLLRQKCAVAFEYMRTEKISDISDNDKQKLVAARASILDIEANNTIYDEDTLDLSRTKVALFFVANYFEEMAIEIYQRETNERMLKSFYISMLVRFYSNFLEFIPCLSGYHPHPQHLGCALARRLSVHPTYSGCGFQPDRHGLSQ